MSAETIFHYFPKLTTEQQDQFGRLLPLYEEWNAKINVISRKDMENFYWHHVLHSLGIAKVISFEPETRLIDVGTGGGFPGIPLAILFPGSSFHLVDSIGKKIRVVEAIVKDLGLKNVTAEQTRAESLPRHSADFVISRAVTALPEFHTWTQKLIRPGGKNTLRNGTLYLKGGDLEEEIRPFKRKIIVFDLKDYFSEDFFESKKVVYLSE